MSLRTPSDGAILAINGGSSSLKFALFRREDPLRRELAGNIERIGFKNSRAILSDAAGTQTVRTLSAGDHGAAARWLIDILEQRYSRETIAAIGHRIVNGGAKYFRHEPVTPILLEDLRQLSPFDPEHLPTEIELLNLFRSRFPDLPQVACFDTVFHHAMPRVAQLISIPRRFEGKGVRRFGFHGLSYAFLLGELEKIAGPRAARGRLVFCHLGSGASLAAIHDGKSIDTSMGFSPASGLPMSTRSGDLDPELVWFLRRTEQMEAGAFHHMVNHESGLLGVSETSSDIRDLLAQEASDIRSAEAVDLFCYQIRKTIGAFAAALGGLNTLVFSGGIGENAPSIRKRACRGLEFLGVELMDARNETNAALISSDQSEVAVRVIRTDEESMIAVAVQRYLADTVGKVT